MRKLLGRLLPKSRRARALLLLAAIPTLMILLASLVFSAAVAWWPYPANVDRPPVGSTWIEDRDDNLLAAYVGAGEQWQLPLTREQISPHLLDAIVAAEDGHFYEHHGVDWKAVAASTWQDARALNIRRGASTLTMQLYRLRDPAPRSFAGKLVQAIRAEQIEKRESKQAILVDYLNRAPFGGNLVGAGAASWRYFGRPCRELSLGQAALLAGLPQNPKKLRPDRFPQRALARRNYVLDRMLACRMISQTEHDEAMKEPIDAAWRPLPQETPGDSAKTLQPVLARLAGQFPSQTLRTTIDLATQQKTSSAVVEAMQTLSPSHITSAAVVVLDTSTGQCLATVSISSGGQIDLAMCPRSSGSTLKPFIYAAAFDAGISTPTTIVDDSPAAWAGYSPDNYDHDFRGQMPASLALAQSRNIPAIVILSKVGIDRALEVMRSTGLVSLAQTPDRYGLPLAIGGAEVTPMALAEAYATLGRGGKHFPATLMFGADRAKPQATTGAGLAIDVLLPGSALRTETCWEVLHCLDDVERTRAVCPAAATLAPAWKTGTSSGHRDAWCAAVTPRRTIVVWLGNADGAGSDHLVGQEAAAPLALRVLSMIDPGGDAFPPAHISQPSIAPLLPPPARLVLVSPIDGQQIFSEPSIPAAQQRLALLAHVEGANESAKLWWFIDGQPLQNADANSPSAWWQPIPGTHEIRVVDLSGHEAHVHVRVQ